MTESIVIVGAGGHAKVVADILIQSNRVVAGFLDDNVDLHGEKILGLPILGSISDWALFSPTGLIVGIGNNRVRNAIVEQLGNTVDHLWIPAVHPKAIIATNVSIGAGTVVMAGAIVNPDTHIGQHVIVNTGATIDHDCQIADYVHIAPGVNLTGGITIGQGTLIGAGATIIPYKTIGSFCTIGAGAAVIKDIPDNVTAVGVPAQWKL